MMKIACLILTLGLLCPTLSAQSEELQSEALPPDLRVAPRSLRPSRPREPGRVTSEGEESGTFLMGIPVSFTSTEHGGRIATRSPDEVAVPMDDPVDTAGLISHIRSQPHFPDDVRIVAMSLGVDVIEASLVTLKAGDFLDGDSAVGTKIAVAEVDGALHGWLGMVFSVDNPLSGSGEISPVIRQAGASRESSLFAFVFPESSGVDVSDYGVSLLALGPADLGIPAEARIDAVSIPMAMVHDRAQLWGDNHFSRSLPDNPTVYFVLSEPSLRRQIFKTTWNSSTNTWGPIGTFFDFREQHRVNPIDGISIDTFPDSSGEEMKQIIFSEVSAGAQNEVKYIEKRGASGTWSQPALYSYRQPGTPSFYTVGGAIKSDSGLGDFCTIDPVLKDITGNPTAAPLTFDGLVARRSYPLVEDKSSVRLRASAFRYGHRVKSYMIPEMRLPDGRCRVYWKVMNRHDVDVERGSREFIYEGRRVDQLIKLPDSVKDPGSKGRVEIIWKLQYHGATYCSPTLILRL